MKTRLLLSIILVAFVSTISEAQWSAPVNLSPASVSAGLNESMGPCMAASGDTVHVVWCDRLGTNKGAIYYTHSCDTGLTWSNPIPITPLTVNAWNPAIVVNGANLHVVWREIDTVNNHRSSHYCRSLNGGNTWGANVTLDTAIADWPAVAVAGNRVYVANDIVTSASPYNTEVFFLRSTDNGTTWSALQQITFATGRSEDEAIMAQGSYVHMAWNDNRFNSKMRILYQHSSDYGTTWSAADTIAPPFAYGTMVNSMNSNIDIPFAGAPSGHYQLHLVQSSDNGLSWGADRDLSLDPVNTYYYPYLVRDGADLHLTYVKSGVGGQYLHSADGGTTWDAPYTFFTGTIGITAFPAFTGCVVHIIYANNTDHHIYYVRNPTANAGHCPIITHVADKIIPSTISIYPNPATDNLTIVSSQKVIIQIFSIEGQMMKTINDNDEETTIDVTNFSSGVYVIKAITDKGVTIKKFIKP